MMQQNVNELHMWSRHMYRLFYKCSCATTVMSDSHPVHSTVKAIENSRLCPACTTHCSHPQPNSVVYSKAYGWRMSVSRRQCKEGQSWSAEDLSLSALPPAAWHPLAMSLTLHHMLYCAKAWHLPQNRKYITYYTVVRGLSHDHI